MKVAKQILISFKGADRRRKGNGNLRGSVCNMWPKGIHYHLALPRGDWLFCGQYNKQNNKLYWTLVLLCILFSASNLASPAWLWLTKVNMKLWSTVLFFLSPPYFWNLPFYKKKGLSHMSLVPAFFRRRAIPRLIGFCLHLLMMGGRRAVSRLADPSTSQSTAGHCTYLI